MISSHIIIIFIGLVTSTRILCVVKLLSTVHFLNQILSDRRDVFPEFVS